MKKIFTNTLLLFSSLIVALVIFELFLRIAGLGWPIFTQADHLTGISLRPNASGWNVDEQRAYVQINSEGWRDYEHGEKTQKRIAILGDSFTEARQVDIKDTFWSQISCAEVLNFGVSGFGTAQEYLILRDRVLQYEPDLVVLAFHTGNDVKNNSHEIEGGDGPYLENGEFTFDFRETDFFISQNKWYNKLLMKGINHSRVLQLLNRVRKIKYVRERIVVENEAPKTHDPFGVPSSPAWERAWQTTETLLTMIHKLSPQFVLLMVSSREQIRPEGTPEELQELLYPSHRLQALAEKEGFTFIDPVPAMQKEALEKGTYFHGFDQTGNGHWNERGHAIVGEMLEKTVCDMLATQPL